MSDYPVQLELDGVLVGEWQSKADLTVDDGYELYIYEDGSVTSTTIVDGGYAFLNGGSAYNTTVGDGGYFDSDESGYACGTTLTDGAEMFVADGITIENTTVGSGALLTIHGFSTGTLSVADGATVILGNNGIIDFDISGSTPGSAARVSNLDGIESYGSYTITVSSSLQYGDYVLASGAASFAGKCSVIVDGMPLDKTISVNGPAIDDGDNSYSLSRVSGDDRLVLTISDYSGGPTSDTVPPTLTGSLGCSDRVGGCYVSFTGLVASDNVGVVGYKLYVDNVFVSAYQTTVSTAAVTLNTAGEHMIGVTAYDAAGNESARLNVEAENIIDEFNSATYLGSDLGIVSVADASISVSGEEDYYCFKLTSAGTVTLTTAGDPDKEEDDGDTMLRLYNDRRGMIAEDDDSGSGKYSMLSRRLDAGTYYIVVGAYEDTTIDKYSLTVDVTDVGPAIPQVLSVEADITAPTNQNVTVTATFSANTVTKQYSLDGSTWQTYTDGVVMTDNGTVSFRAISAEESVSEVVSYTVTNIDRVPPEVLTITANTTAPTNQPVTVTATFSDDAVTKQYGMTNSVSFGDFLYNNYYGEWSEYVDGVVVDKNRAVYFRCIDAAGNVSENGKYLVMNIDTRIPVLVSLEADVSEPTNGDVTLTATFDDQSQIQYRLDGGTWTDVETSYTPNGPNSIGGPATQNGIYFASVTVSANGTVYFRAVDPAGNISDVASYEVANIDKTAPDKPTASADVTAPTNQPVTVTAAFSDDTATKEYSLDGSTWLEYTTGVVMTANGTVYFRGIDAVGNISEVTGYEVDNISLVAPEPPVASADITTPTNQNVTVTATFDDITATKQYSLDNSTWQTYTTGVAMSDNGTVYFRAISIEGNISNVTAYVVSNIDKVAPEQPVAAADRTALTNLNVTVTATFSDDSARKQYRIDDGDWNDYTTGVVMTANGIVSFRGIDVAGNASAITSYEVSNIDTVPPEAPTVTPDITAPTNGNVKLTVTFSADTVSRWVSFDNMFWMQCGTVITRGENGTVYFRGLDAAGNFSAVTSYTVSNIDRVPPEAPVASADITSATNQDVTVTATFSSDSAQKQYSLDNTTWQAYTSGVAMTANGTVYFRGIDAAGNVSDVASYAVTNIDKVPPAKPTAAASTTAPTNQDVTVTATFSGDSIVKQYSLDGENWLAYTTGVLMPDNGIVYFRGIDEAGNVSDVASCAVTNIDKVPPVKPTAAADITTPTNQNVTVTATFSGDSIVKQYSLDGENWLAYTTGVAMTANGTVYFRGIDAAGNVSDVASCAVTNIDKVPPAKPTAAADITTPTNQDVTVTAVFSADSAQKQYSLDGENWLAYTTGVVMHANGTVCFRGVDEAGNISEVASYEVGNIDRIAPDLPVAAADITTPTNQNVTVTAVFDDKAVVRQYSLDGEFWQEYTTGVVMTDNGAVYFRGISVEGNVSNVAAYVVGNIDRVPPEVLSTSASTTAPTNQSVTVTAVFSADSVQKQYRINDGDWTAYTDGVAMTANGTVCFRSIDEAGNISAVASYEVTNIDTVPPEVLSTAASTTAPTNQSVTVTAVFSADSAQKQYRINDGDWTAYTDGVEMTANGTVCFRSIDEAGNISAVASYEVTNIIEVVTELTRNDLNGDNRADVVMTITQTTHPHCGATGAWLIQDTQTAAWGDLSQRNAGWEIFGTGITAAGKTTNDVYIKSTDNIVGAWVTGDDGKVTGWETVGQFDASTQVLGLGDFNGDGQTDLLLRNVNGAVGCYFTSGDVTGWNYFQSLGDEWKICAVGDLNGDGRDDVVLKHDAGFAGSWLTQRDYTMAWANLDTLPSGFEIVGCGDFDGDGTSDVLLKNGNYYGAWLVQNGNAAGWFGLGDLGGVTVEQIADFDADGADDLRIRTAAGDLGAQLVKGADSLVWKYYGSVGQEWSTSLAAL